MTKLKTIKSKLEQVKDKWIKDGTSIEAFWWPVLEDALLAHDYKDSLVYFEGRLKKLKAENKILKHRNECLEETLGGRDYDQS